jgi:hypothetical protein
VWRAEWSASDEARWGDRPRADQGIISVPEEHGTQTLRNAKWHGRNPPRRRRATSAVKGDKGGQMDQSVKKKPAARGAVPWTVRAKCWPVACRVPARVPAV